MLRDLLLPSLGASVLAMTPGFQQATETALTVPTDVRTALEYGLGYLLVVVLLVPLMRWVMGSVIQSQKNRDEMLREMIGELSIATRSMEDTVRTFKAFEATEEATHRQIVDKLERIARKLDA